MWKALMCRLKFHRLQQKPSPTALDVTAQIIVYHPTYIPAYIERMYVLLEMGYWEQIVEAAQRLSAISPESLDVTAVLCLSEVCREGRAKQAANLVSNLSQVFALFITLKIICVCFKIFT
jgi:hypothetical protein